MCALLLPLVHILDGPHRHTPCLTHTAAMPLMDVVRLDTMVTVVDSGVFLDAYVSRDKLTQRPELGAFAWVFLWMRDGKGGSLFVLCWRRE